MRKNRKSIPQSQPYLVQLKRRVPETIAAYENDHVRRVGWSTPHEIFLQWADQPVEPYGLISPGYGDKAPYNRPHIAVRLGIPGAAGYSVVALGELVEPLDMNRVPARPSYPGGISYNPGHCEARYLRSE